MPSLGTLVVGAAIAVLALLYLAVALLYGWVLDYVVNRRNTERDTGPVQALRDDCRRAWRWIRRAPPPGSLAEAIANGTKEQWRRRAMLAPGSLGRQVLEFPSYASVRQEMDATGTDFETAFAVCQVRLREALDAEWQVIQDKPEGA